MGGIVTVNGKPHSAAGSAAKSASAAPATAQSGNTETKTAASSGPGATATPVAKPGSSTSPAKTVQTPVERLDGKFGGGSLPESGNESGTKPAQTPTPVAPEAAKSDEPVAPTPEQLAAKQFSAIARREREVAAKEKALKGREEAAKAFEKAKADALRDPLGYLKAAGLEFESVAKAVVNPEVAPPELREKALEQRVDAMEAERRAEMQRAEVAKLTQFKNDIKAFVDDAKHDAAPEGHPYEVIKSQGAYGLVFEVIAAYHDEHPGVLLPFDQAAAHVEKHLRAEKAAELDKLSKTKAFSSKFAPTAPQGVSDASTTAAPAPGTTAVPAAPPAAAGSPSPKPANTTRQTVTLTNRNSISRTSTSKPKLSDRERLKKAADMLSFDGNGLEGIPVVGNGSR